MTIKELIFSSIKIIESIPKYWIFIQYFATKKVDPYEFSAAKKKKKNKRHKYSEFQHADRSFDLVANKFLPPFSDSPSLCKGKPRPFSPPPSLPLYSSVAAKRCIPLSASFSHLLVSQGISSRINEGSTRFRRGRRFFWRGLHSPNGQSRAHQTECGIPSR